MVLRRGAVALLGLLAAAAVAHGADSGDAGLRVAQVWGEVGRINALSQTPDGFLWIGSDRGLFAFDGVRFRELALDAAPIHEVRSLTTDARGDLWVGLAEPARVMRVHGGRSSLFCSDPRWAHDAAVVIAPAGQDDAWVGTQAGAWHCGRGQVEGPLSPAAPVTMIVLDVDRPVLVGGPSGLRRVIAGGGLELVTGQGFSSAVRDEDGTVWLAGTGRELHRWRDDTLTLALSARDLPGAVQSLALARSGRGVWVGTTQGVLLADGAGRTSIVHVAPALPDPRISAVL